MIKIERREEIIKELFEVEVLGLGVGFCFLNFIFCSFIVLKYGL